MNTWHKTGAACFFPCSSLYLRCVLSCDDVICAKGFAVAWWWATGAASDFHDNQLHLWNAHRTPCKSRFFTFIWSIVWEVVADDVRCLRIWGHHSLCADLLTTHDCLKLIRVFCDSFHAPAATSMRNILLFASNPPVRLHLSAFVHVSHLSMYSFYLFLSSFYLFFFSFASRPHSALVFLVYVFLAAAGVAVILLSCLLFLFYRSFSVCFFIILVPSSSFLFWQLNPVQIRSAKMIRNDSNLQNCVPPMSRPMAPLMFSLTWLFLHSQTRSQKTDPWSKRRNVGYWKRYAKLVIEISWVLWFLAILQWNYPVGSP